jgi:hypothetical protein
MCPNCLMYLGLALSGAGSAALAAVAGLRSTSIRSRNRVAETNTEETAS